METRNDLLKRKEVSFVMEAKGNPGFEEAKKQVIDKFNADGENVVVKNVLNNFGSGEFLVEAFVYDSAEHREKIEPRKKGGKK